VTNGKYYSILRYSKYYNALDHRREAGMKNPFKYGESVTGECFANRQREIREIKAAIKSAQNIFIYSYRRLGKTSLIKTVLKSLAKDRSIIPIYVDLQRAPFFMSF